MDAAEQLSSNMLEFALSRGMHYQLCLALLATIVSAFCARLVSAALGRVDAETDGPLLRARRVVGAIRQLTFPILHVIFAGAAIEIAATWPGHDLVVRGFAGLAGAHLLLRFEHTFVRTRVPAMLLRWIGVPLVLLLAVGLLDEITIWMDGLAVEIGNIRISLLVIARTLLFGTLLFWLGRASQVAGARAIRQQPDLDPGTKEIFAKLFEIVLFVLIFLLLLNVVGINLTTLAVFGGALGVGLGFGLQQIASNFISGIIILLDRSLQLGDYIQFDDGPCGRLSELNMRYSVIETFDGKEVMVPNERFITETFVNWTHSNPKQRYPINFQVAYGTDLDALFPLLREVVSSHPKVLAGPEVPFEERPDAEIAGFGESGIDILVEFWMEGVDDGRNRVGADLLHMIWNALQEHGMVIPFPQREVRIIGGGDSPTR